MCVATIDQDMEIGFCMGSVVGGTGMGMFVGWTSSWYRRVATTLKYGISLCLFGSFASVAD